MAISKSRKVVVGETPYAHEREALDFAFSVLPDTDPFQVWALTELLEPSTGRLYEIDLLVLGYSALYLVEIKSGPGRYEGDHQEWWRTPPGETRPRYMDGPLSLANHKAKVLKSRLTSKMRTPKSCPYVEALIFPSASDLDVRLSAEGRVGVVTRSELYPAVQHHRFAGANPNWQGDKIARPVMHDVAQAMSALGLRPRKGLAHAGSYELGSLIADGAGYQDREARHRDRGFKTRARVYLVPQQASVERRQQLRRAADREATLLWDVREHPSILRIADYVTDAPLGPTVLFDDFADGVPLDGFLRQHPTLAFDERLAIVEQVGRALAHCHRKSIVHGAVAPQSVLVRRNPDTHAIDARLFNFQLGAGREVDVTQHWSALADETWAVYQAPELRENPLARSPQSDIWSLGALAYFAFTGRAPGDRVEDIDRRLGAKRYLDPRAVDDAIRPGIADVFEFATEVAPVNRVDNVDDWLELLLGAATAPESPKPVEEQDPLEATKGSLLGGGLGGGLEVLGVLGVGSTSRVLLVRRPKDDRRYALKVSSDVSHDARLADEAWVLSPKNLPRHPRIVDLVDEPTLKGRKCLLLSLAGEMTLQRKLASFGPVSLDEASRYGDDLLMALEHLEEHQVLHRDVKPANLGVGSVSKLADHLTLFDFSLSRLPVSEVQVGTAVYRDPYLRADGRAGWDFAADRWSAAITLHEMLAGTRPTFAGGSALDADARLELAAERFDATVRDDLVRFFEWAFARDAKLRHASAQEMRHAWVAIRGSPRALEGGARTGRRPGGARRVEAHRRRSRAHSGRRAGRRAAPLGSRPQRARPGRPHPHPGPPRARPQPALRDPRRGPARRPGDPRFSRPLELPSARLGGGAPGVLSRLWRRGPARRRRDRPGRSSARPRRRAHRGRSPVSEDARSGSRDAREEPGRAPRWRPRGGASRARERERTRQPASSTDDAGGLDRDDGSTQARAQGSPPRPGALFGLDPPFEGRLDVTVREVAEKEGKTPAAVYIALGKARDEWSAHAAVPELRERAARLLEAFGGAAPLATLAEDIAGAIPHASDTSPDVVRAMAATLLRVVVEVDKDGAAGARLVRLHDRQPWIFASDEQARLTRELAKRADELAASATLVSTGEVRRNFAEIVAGTPLARLSEARLFELAAAASETAACSARLEIYPRGLDPKRAVELCAATFKGGVREAEVRARVHLRYPAAAPLPERPLLDQLLEPLGFTWDAARAAYTRPGEDQTTALETHVSSSGARAPTALPSQPRAMDPDAIDARQFDDTLKHSLEMNAFRLVGVRADRAHAAALALRSRLGADLVLLDVELGKEITAQMKKANMKGDEVVHAADREGPEGPAWKNLQKLVHAAADALAQRLFPAARPLLLVQPGPIARYGLIAFVERIVAEGTNRETPAVFLLVPAHDTGGQPRIDGTFVVPGVLPGQSIWVSGAWLANRHNAAA